MAKKTGNNRFNIEWIYAKTCWDALKNNSEVPPIPSYDMWETTESDGRRKYVGTKEITPMRVTCNGKTLYE